MVDPAANLLDRFPALLFDLDGVITPTVLVHLRAWRDAFDRVFAAHGAPPFTDADYYGALDGRPRFEGVAALARARDLDLPAGQPTDVGFGTVWGIGNAKNRIFAELLAEGIAPYPGTMRLLDALRERGAALGVVSSSRNAEAVLRAAGVRDRFRVVVDGVVAADEGLPGKPAPHTFLAAAERLGFAPGDTAVLEDATSGVEAAARGSFGLVVGVDRGAGAAALRAAGADLVVADLGELV